MPIRFATRLTCAVLAALTCLHCGPLSSASDETPASDTQQTSAAIIYCPRTDPDYPYCGTDPGPVEDCSKVAATFVASPSTIQQGQSSTLYWSVTGLSNCSGTLTLNSVPVGISGSMAVSPVATQPYQLYLGSTRIASTTVNVVLPGAVRIKQNTGEYKRLLVQAVGTPNTRVVLEGNIDMDLTGWENIYVAPGVTLTSEAPPLIFNGGFASKTTASLIKLPILEGPPLRDAKNLGPRLYTTGKPHPLFTMSCSDWNDVHIRFIGFRLQGPHWGTEEGDDNLERGISIDSCVGVEIANMELSGWSGQAIYLVDNAVTMFNPDAVKIHDNFFHHNQHAGGNGYGVDVGAGAYAKLERNLFDFNRHAIAASGKPGTGYWAERNLVLKGGGVHDGFLNHYTHQFDVHGDANCPNLPGFQHVWNCGNAGDQFWYLYNAFQYTNDHAIKLRGTVRVQAVIQNNVFAHDDVDDAIELYDSLHVIQGGNRGGVDPFGDYGVCDFDGDGQDDLFLATGVSWWFSSGGKREWRYLNAATERLSQVGLGDFDGDRRCDVLAASGSSWVISSGGTGYWTALPGTYSVPMSELRFADFNADRITDVFRRAPDGQWWVVSPGHFDWVPLQSSSFPLSELKLGDFNGDGVADVMGKNGGVWSVSWSGTSTWQPLGSGLSDDISSLYVGDVDGIPGDDVVRYVPTGTSTGRWDVSSGGHTGWQTLGTYTASGDALGDLVPAYRVRTFLGRFDVWAGGDVLAIDAGRRSTLFSAGHSNFAPYGLYAY